jgi:GntR family transcriptional regulator
MNSTTCLPDVKVKFEPALTPGKVLDPSYMISAALTLRVKRSTVNFALDEHSPLPPHAQIQEKIKLALLLGQLRPGDTLPSIRDVEQETGINRNIVHKAYLALQSLGILNLRHGKGVLVQKQLSYGARDTVRQKCETLSKELLPRLRELGVSPSAFARFLYQQAREHEIQTPFIVFVDATKAQAIERAGHISAVWQVNIPGYSLDELAEIPKQDMQAIRKILTNYVRFDQVRRIVRNRAEVIPLGLTFTEQSIKEFGRLPAGANLVLILDDEDYPSLSLLVELYHKLVLKPGSNIAAIPFSKVHNIHRFVKSAKYDKLIFSNRIWDEIPEELKKNPKVTRPHMVVDLSSLESARIHAGVVI